MISSHGYIKIYVGLKHSLADSKGYAYEHRIIAENILGRSLFKGEQVHHINGIRTDNRPENIQIVKGRYYHAVKHRKRQDLCLPDELNLMINCACGCGAKFLKYDKTGRPRKFLPGHNKQSIERPFCACGCGERVKHIKSKYKSHHYSKKHKKEMVICACGCENIILKYDAHGRERRYISGHNMRKNRR